MRRLPRHHNLVATAEEIRRARQLLPMTLDHTPEQIGAVIGEALGTKPRLDMAQLIGEYKLLRDGIAALAEDMATSDDMDELRLLMATIREIKMGLEAAKWPAEARLQRLENEERYSSPSWARTS